MFKVGERVRDLQGHLGTVVGVVERYDVRWDGQRQSDGFHKYRPQDLRSEGVPAPKPAVLVPGSKTTSW